jgi:hypothetical protein
MKRACPIAIAALFAAGCATRAAGSEGPEARPGAPTPAAPPAAVQAGPCDVPPTGRDIVVAEPFDALDLLGRIRQGMSPGEVAQALGPPEEVRCGDEPRRWFYTYERPAMTGDDRWMILMVEFTGDVVSFQAWLPSG